jgi:circadian clock protein KaiC
MINSNGLHIGKPFRTISGILSGQFTHLPPDEIERLGNLFHDDTEGI